VSLVVVEEFVSRLQTGASVVDNNYNTPVVQDRIVLVRLHRTSNRRIHCPFELDIVVGRRGIR
jgi:hypothetical protein